MSSSPPIEAREQDETPEITVEGLVRHAWLDRDLSWLEFNRRVLEEALDGRNRLLERVKFLAIFSSNLDEFFMKRMALIRPESDDASLAAQERRDLLVRKREVITAMLVGAGRVLPRGDQTAARRARHPSRRLGRTHRRPVPGALARVRPADLAGADTAQSRRGTSIPVRLESVDVVGVSARRSSQRRVGAGARQGAARAPAVVARPRGRREAVARLRRDRPGDRGQRRASLPRNDDHERQPFPGQSRRRGRARGRRREQARPRRARSCASVVSSRSCAWRCSRTRSRRWCRSSSSGSRSRTRTSTRCPH